MTSLRELPIGKTATIRSVGGEGALRQHFLDMGLIPKGEVTMVKYAPMGDPMELRIHSYELTLRLADAEKIEIENIRDAVSVPDSRALHKNNTARTIPHPGLGEGGKYHKKETEHPLPDNEILTFALAGNQNCGKTTLFNQLTGSSQHVGNFPGVTVDRKDGNIRGKSNTLVTDLPGIYSMSPYSSEEIVTRNFVLDEHPKGIINIVDATNIERNLYLTMQLMELDIPMVLALNMMDEVRENGGSILVNQMEDMLGIPVIPISAAKNEGIDELVQHAIHVAKYQERPQPIDFCDVNEDGGAVHRCLHAIMHLIEDHAKAVGIPVRFAAAKLAEGDSLIMESLKLDQNEKETLEHIVKQMEKERGLDRAAAIAHMRFDFIEKVCDETVVKPKESKEHLRSMKIDRILTGKYTAIPCFIGIMGLVFFLTFSVIGAFLQNLLEMGITALGNIVDQWMRAAGVNDVIHSLVMDGVFNGVGSVLSFLPVIVTLFFFLSLLEDSGYMARVAFVMDKHDTIGIDAVAMCVNDIACSGGEPLFFLDYIACGKNYPEKIATIVSGVAEGCKQSGCALVGGETAEHPGLMPENDYDLAGFAVGVVDKKDIIDGSDIKPGDVLVAMPSTGVHSNGFSLVRKVFDITEESLNTYYDELGKTLGEALLAPTRIYVKALKNVKEAGVRVKGCSHITGGGFYENIPRMLPEGIRAVVKKDSYEIPAIFNLIAKTGNIAEEMMYNTFNMGIGMVVAVDEKDVDATIKAMKEAGDEAFVVGYVEAGEKGVTLC